MKPNFNNCSDIKGLRFFTKEICPYYCRFLHTQKDSGGASIHRINESFPLKPSLVLSEIGYFLTTSFSPFTGKEPMSIPKASTNFAFATLSDMALAAKKLNWPSWKCQEFWH